MIITILSLILFLIFSILGGFHFYWFFGGTWGLEKVIPTKENTINMPSIPKFATLIVALVLVVFGFLYFIKTRFVNVQIPNFVLNYVYWFIPSVFLLRAIGDFNYVGFFKKIKNTEFAKADSKIFSPLCLLIGIIGVIIQFVHNL